MNHTPEELWGNLINKTLKLNLEIMNIISQKIKFSKTTPKQVSQPPLTPLAEPQIQPNSNSPRTTGNTWDKPLDILALKQPQQPQQPQQKFKNKKYKNRPF